MTDPRVPPGAPPPQPYDAPPTLGHLQELLDEIIIEVEQARTVPLSGSVMVNRDEFLEKLYRLRSELPDELRAARWMVREREAFVARTNERARELLDKAKQRCQELVGESYIVKEAVEEANSLVRRAETDARRIRLEAEDYAETRLAEAETVLGELLQEVRSARGELHESRPPAVEPPLSE